MLERTANVFDHRQCGYRSARGKLYEDMEPKPASANYGFQVGSKRTYASSTTICKMLLAGDIQRRRCLASSYR